jgi:hypothetical protein
MVRAQRRDAVLDLGGERAELVGAAMNRTSSPTWRRKRACASAGSSEPTRLPRCLTPLM